MSKSARVGRDVIHAAAQWIGMYGIITGSYRRGATECGDLDYVVPYSSDEEQYAFEDMLFDLWGSQVTNFRKPKTTGKVIVVVSEKPWEVAAQVHLCKIGCLGSMLLHTTGSVDFNKYMRTVAIKQGMKLNQYGLIMRDGLLLESQYEEDFFKALGMKYYSPEERNSDQWRR